MIPLASTTITVTRNVGYQTGDPYDPGTAPDPETVATSVRAVISPPAGAAKLAGGERVVYQAALRCDPTDIQPGDKVTDSSGLVWTVLWATQIDALGQTFTNAQLRLVTGAV